MTTRLKLILIILIISAAVNNWMLYYRGTQIDALADLEVRNTANVHEMVRNVFEVVSNEKAIVRLLSDYEARIHELEQWRRPAEYSPMPIGGTIITIDPPVLTGPGRSLP